MLGVSYSTGCGPGVFLDVGLLPLTSSREIVPHSKASSELKPLRLSVLRPFSRPSIPPQRRKLASFWDQPTSTFD